MLHSIIGLTAMVADTADTEQPTPRPRGRTRKALNATGLALIVAIIAAPDAAANATITDGPATLKVIGTGLTVVETMTTLAVDNGHSGNLQAYYLIVPPGGDPRKAEKHYSPHIFTGPMPAGVARDSYGPTGGFLEGTSLCAGWWDPSGTVTIPGLPCATISA
ncbi:hypothetical protein AB0L82_32675 [Nocardia sp. NPDC052001]|uniref:hypothetical protein n=1 Tax=Nocardia sp. NPDC052001 TaxID=3154853 RepID=UPI003427DFB9